MADSDWWKGGGASLDFDALGIGSRQNTAALYTDSTTVKNKGRKCVKLNSNSSRKPCLYGPYTQDVTWERETDWPIPGSWERYSFNDAHVLIKAYTSEKPKVELGEHTVDLCAMVQMTKSDPLLRRRVRATDCNGDRLQQLHRKKLAEMACRFRRSRARYLWGLLRSEMKLCAAMMNRDLLAAQNKAQRKRKKKRASMGDSGFICPQCLKVFSNALSLSDHFASCVLPKDRIPNLMSPVPSADRNTNKMSDAASVPLPAPQLVDTAKEEKLKSFTALLLDPTSEAPPAPPSRGNFKKSAATDNTNKESFPAPAIEDPAPPYTDSPVSRRKRRDGKYSDDHPLDKSFLERALPPPHEERADSLGPPPSPKSSPPASPTSEDPPPPPLEPPLEPYPAPPPPPFDPDCLPPPDAGDASDPQTCAAAKDAHAAATPRGVAKIGLAKAKEGADKDSRSDFPVLKSTSTAVTLPRGLVLKQRSMVRRRSHHYDELPLPARRNSNKACHVRATTENVCLAISKSVEARHGLARFVVYCVTIDVADFAYPQRHRFWMVKRRFSEFLAMDKLLRKRFALELLPTFPGRDSTRPEREVLLAKYLTQLQQVPDVFRSREVINFLSAPPHRLDFELDPLHRVTRFLLRKHDPVDVVIKAGTGYSTTVNVADPPQTVVWQFSTEQYDVGFTAQHISSNGEMGPRVPHVRHNSHSHTVFGHLTVFTRGECKLQWDNAYSKLRKKKLTYSYELLDINLWKSMAHDAAMFEGAVNRSCLDGLPALLTVAQQLHQGLCTEEQYKKVRAVARLTRRRPSLLPNQRNMARASAQRPSVPTIMSGAVGKALARPSNAQTLLHILPITSVDGLVCLHGVCRQLSGAVRAEVTRRLQSCRPLGDVSVAPPQDQQDLVRAQTKNKFKMRQRDLSLATLVGRSAAPFREELWALKFFSQRGLPKHHPTEASIRKRSEALRARLWEPNKMEGDDALEAFMSGLKDALAARELRFTMQQFLEAVARIKVHLKAKGPDDHHTAWRKSLAPAVGLVVKQCCFERPSLSDDMISSSLVQTHKMIPRKTEDPATLSSAAQASPNCTSQCQLTSCAWDAGRGNFLFLCCDQGHGQIWQCFDEADESSSAFQPARALGINLRTERPCGCSMSDFSSSDGGMVVFGSQFATHVQLIHCTGQNWNSPTSLRTQVFIGHQGYVSATAFMSQMTQIVSASGDATAKVWDIENTRVVFDACDHRADVLSVTTTRLHRTLFATSSSDCGIHLYDTRTNTGACAIFDGFSSDVNEVRFHPAGSRIVGCSADETARVFELRYGSTSPDGECKPVRMLRAGNSIQTCEFVASSRSMNELLVLGVGRDLKAPLNSRLAPKPAKTVPRFDDQHGCSRFHTFTSCNSMVSCVRRSALGCLAVTSQDSVVSLWSPP